MVAKSEFPSEAWEKLRALIEGARSNPQLSQDLRTRPPAEVRDILRDRFHLSADEVTDLISQFEYIADRNSLQWWSPLR